MNDMHMLSTKEASQLVSKVTTRAHCVVSHEEIVKLPFRDWGHLIRENGSQKVIMSIEGHRFLRTNVLHICLNPEMAPNDALRRRIEISIYAFIKQ